jgi:uncharacterized protein DUF1905
LQGILGDNLVALWAHDGTTFADRPRRTDDLDTYAVIDRPPDELTARTIEGAHTAIARDNGVDWDPLWRWSGNCWTDDRGMTRDESEVGMIPGEMFLEFPGELYSWRGPAPYHFIKVPDEECVALREVSPVVSYGWGVIPVRVRIGESVFETSLFPKDAGYLVPRDVVRKAEGLVIGDTVMVELAIGS